MSTAKTPEPQVDQNVGATEESPIEKKTPSKRTRLSFIERAQKESEELVKTMGGTLELEGGRRTRSSTRGTPSRPAVVTPPPTKKARNSPASPKTTPRARGRGRKLDTSVTPEPPEQTSNKEPELEKEEAPVAKAVTPPVEDVQDSVKEKSTESVKKTDEAETNGPENLEDGQNKNNAETDNSVTVSQPEAQQSENEQLPAVVEDSKSSDQVDTAEKKVKDQLSEPESQVKAESKSIEAAVATLEDESTKKDSKPEPEAAAPAEVADSPMEVDEQPEEPESNSVPTQNSTEKKSAEALITTTASDADSTPAVEKEPVQSEPEPEPAVEAATVKTPLESSKPVAEKQPTPEPMEVDSSSKSSDVVECTDVVDKAEANSEKTNSTVEPTEQVVKNAVASESESEPADLIVATPDSLPLTQTQHNTEQNCTSVAVNNEKVVEDVPSVPVTTDIKSIDATEATKIDAVRENKAENNVGEPKLLSPALSATGDVAAAVTTS